MKTIDTLLARVIEAQKQIATLPDLSDLNEAVQIANTSSAEGLASELADDAGKNTLRRLVNLARTLVDAYDAQQLKLADFLAKAEVVETFVNKLAVVSEGVPVVPATEDTRVTRRSLKVRPRAARAVEWPKKDRNKKGAPEKVDQAALEEAAKAKVVEQQAAIEAAHAAMQLALRGYNAALTSQAALKARVVKRVGSW